MMLRLGAEMILEKLARILLFVLPAPNPMLAGLHAFSVLTLALCCSLASEGCELTRMKVCSIRQEALQRSQMTPARALHLQLQGKEEMLSWSGHSVFEGVQSPMQSDHFRTAPVC